MDILEVIKKRRSVRKYQNKEVSLELIQPLLEAAMAAPSACNFQPWEFVVVTEVDMMNKLRKVLTFGPYNAPAAIVVCANMSFLKGSQARHWEQDCSASMENILIAATGLGLGSCWIGVHPIPSVVEPVRKVLNIPKHVNPLGIAYIGYSDEIKEPRTQYNEKVVYYHSYDPNRKHRARDKNLKYKE